MKRKRAYRQGLGLALVAVVVATAATLASAATHSRKVTTITFWQTYNTGETPTLDKLVSQFEASHPSIKVDVTYVDFGSHAQKFQTAAQAGQGPDIMRADNAPDVQGWAAQGFLTDLTSMVSASDRKDYLQSALAGSIYQGKLYALPQTVDALALLYNRSLFAKAGIKHPPTTLAELTSDCRKFGAGKGLFLNANDYWLSPWLWSYGGGFVSIAKKEIYIASKGSVAGWTAFNTLFHDKCTFPNKDFANSYNNMQTAFKNGQVAMVVNGPWSTQDDLSGTAFKSSSNLQVAPIPAGPAGQGSPIGGGSFVISRNSKNVQEAYTFVSWLNDPAQEAAWAAGTNDLPSRVSAYKSPLVKKNRILTQFLAQMKVARDRSAGTQGGQLYGNDLEAPLEKMLSGGTTPAAAAASVASAWASKLFPGFKIVK